MSRTIKLLYAMAFLLAMATGVALAQTTQAFVFCGDGDEQRKQCNGTPGEDQIIGTEGRDNVFAKGGKDFVDAGPGNDKVNGEDGDDQGIFRGDGGGGTTMSVDDADTLGWMGGGGLIGGDGNDTINGGDGGDDMDDSGGTQCLGGCVTGNGEPPPPSSDKDRLNGGNGVDFMDASDGDGRDVLDGGPGNDLCMADPGDKVISCTEL